MKDRTSERFIRQTCLVTALLLCLQPSAHAHGFINKAQGEVKQLESGQFIEREIAGGQTHTYQIQLAAGQFVRFRLEQRAIDAALILTAPDGKQMVEMNLTGAGQEEPLSLEVAAAGSYRLTVRGNGVAALRGSYRLEATVQATTTAQHRKRQAAEALLVEATELSKQGGRTAQQVIEKLQQAEPLWRELGEPSWAAHSIFMMGTAHNSLSQFEKTIEYCNQALVIYRELKDRRGEAEAFTILGRASRDLGRNAKAIEYSEQALVIHRELNNRTGEAGILNNMGRVYAGLGRTDKAVESLERGLAIYREVGNRLGEGAALNNLGIVVRDLGRTEKSIENHEQALAIARESKNRQLEADSLVLVGRAYTILGRNEKTIQCYEQALTIYRELKNRNGEANALLNLGLVNKDLGRNEITIEYSAQALTAFREVKNRTGEGNALNNMGRAYAALGLTEKAVESLEGALAIYHELRFRLGEGNALNNLGIIYRDLGRTEKSIENYEQAMAIARELKNQGLEADSLILLGRSYTILGRNEKTIECFEQARTIYRELKNRFGEANAVNNLGSVYEVLGRNEKAIEYYEQGLAIYREIMNKLGEGTALNNIGVANKDLGRHEKAIVYSEQALAIYSEIKYRFGEANALFNLATVNYQLRRYEKAGEYYTQSLGIYREIRNPANEGYSLNSLGAVSRALGRIEEAVKYHEAALKLAREIKSPPSEANSLAQLARDEESRGNLVLARQFIEEHLRIAESVRAEVVSKEDRAEYLATVQGAYQLYVDVLMRQHRAEPGKGLDALAVEVSERLRARSLLDLLAEARADVRRGVDAQLLERERSLGQQLNQKAQLLTKTVQPVQLVTLRKEISQLESDYERTQADIRKASPNYAALTQPQPLKLKEIQAQLDADTMLLEYSLGEQRSYLWTITRDSLASYELPKAEEINRSALRVYELLTARSVNKRLESGPERKARVTQAGVELPAAATELSQMLLSPVASELGNKRLVIVADGALQYIPFAMLPEPKAEGGRMKAETPKQPRFHPSSFISQPLIVRHEVVSLPSASVLAIQRSELAGRPKAQKTLAVIADPVFDRSDARFTTAASEIEKAQPQTIAFNDARSIEHLAGSDKSGGASLKVIPRLPFTRQEATQLLTLTPKDSSFSAIDFRASRTTVLSGDLAQYRYVHFATHGLLDSERPGLSSLVLSMVDAEGKPQDGFLRANDIYNLKLPAELVVLSACQTGLGKEIKGEGLVGLTRGFMYAGAARVVVSLWSVNDKATAELMTKFYEKMLKQGERPAAALRAAQVEMWKQKQWQSPYYWAAFTMQGEWR